MQAHRPGSKMRPDWLGAMMLLFAFQRGRTKSTPQTVEHSGTWVDIYQPLRPPSATVIFVPGLAIRGREDPRIRNLGWALCAAGLRVLIPDVPSIRSLKISSDQPEEVRQLLENLVGDPSMVTTRNISLMSVSFSGVFVLRAALSQALAERTRVLCLIGGYFDIEQVASFLINSNRADVYGRLIIASSYFSDIEPASPAAQVALVRAVEAAAHDNSGPSDLGALFDLADPLEKSLHHVLSDPYEREHFCGKVIAGFDEAWMGYRVPIELPDNMAPVFLLHGRGDRVIPPGESRRLARLFSDSGISHYLCVTDFLGHGDAAISFSQVSELYRLIAGFAWFLGHCRG